MTAHLHLPDNSRPHQRHLFALGNDALAPLDRLVPALPRGFGRDMVATSRQVVRLWVQHWLGEVGDDA